MKKISLIFAALILMLPRLEINAISAYAYVLYEPITQTVLAGENANQRRSMASTTKIMTGILLCENVELNDIVTVKKEMTAVEGTSVGLRVGDRVSYEVLLYGLMLESGNDAAIAIAQSISGSVEDFAALMNEKARLLGMNNSRFVTPNGLDHDEHYSTAYDMALLTAYAMNNKTFARAVASTSYKAVYNDSQTFRTYSNHNKLLWLCDGANGVKTGFTKKSGRCLVSSCTRSGASLICVTLNAYDDWDDHKSLYNFGFDKFEKTNINGYSNRIRLISGEKKYVYAQSDEISLPLLKGAADEIERLICVPEFIYAPIAENECVGSITYKIGANIIAVKKIYIRRKCGLRIPKKMSFAQKYIKTVLELL